MIGLAGRGPTYPMIPHISSSYPQVPECARCARPQVASAHKGASVPPGGLTSAGSLLPGLLPGFLPVGYDRERPRGYPPNISITLFLVASHTRGRALSRNSGTRVPAISVSLNRPSVIGNRLSAGSFQQSARTGSGLSSDGLGTGSTPPGPLSPHSPGRRRWWRHRSWWRLPPSPGPAARYRKAG